MEHGAHAGGGLRLRRPHVTGIVAMAVAAAFSAWLLVKHGGDASWRASVGAGLPATAVEEAGGVRVAPVVLGASDLETQARSLGEPVYWAGPEPGRRYELTRDDQRNVSLRYLPAGAAAGDPRQTLRVSTIPFAAAYSKTQELAARPGAVSRQVPGGGLSWYRPDRPTTVYVAYPNLEYVVEVDSATPGQARSIVFSGRIRPVA